MKEKITNKFIARLVIVSTSVILIIFFINFFATKVDKNGVDALGVFGDKFGASNSLFTGLGIIGLIVTILLQIKEQQRQQEEIEENKNSIDEQNNVLLRQRFETSFFNMLNIHYEIVKGMRLQFKDDNEETVTIDGRQCLIVLFTKLTKDLKLDSPKLIADWENKYYNFFFEYQDILGHYFRNMYRIVKFVDEYDFLKGDGNFKVRYNYIGILRAQLSASELGLVFYNGISSYGSKQFKPLIERYSILKNLDPDDLPFPSHVSNYSSNAFKWEQHTYDDFMKKAETDNWDNV